MNFYRDYELKIAVNGTMITIKPEIRVAFNAVKVNDATLGKSRLIIYNLKESTRLALNKDASQAKRIHVSLSIGYDGRLQKLFSGDIYTCSSVRQGNDFITSMEIYDGGYDYFNSFTAKTVRTKGQAITSILEDMPNTDKGKITQLQELLRPKVLVGNTFKCIRNLISSNERYYIDNGQLFIVKNEEVISGHEPIVSARTGLLNTPKREFSKVTFDTMLNPALRLSGKCVIDSKYDPHLNGLYRIFSINYVGDYGGQDWRQTVEAYLISKYEVL